MSTQLSDAFIDEPPMGLPSWSAKTQLEADYMLKRAGLEMESVPLIGAYILLGRGIKKATEDEIMDAFSSLADEEFDSISEYITRVNDRKIKAAIEVAETPGK